jgi:peptide/nickel transport system permease protein
VDLGPQGLLTVHWLAGRLLQAGLTIAVAVLLFFVLMRLVPGDPLAILQDERPVTRAQEEVLRQRFGLDQPLHAQLRHFVRGALVGDLGVSIQYGRPVTAMLRERLPATLLLGALVLLVNFTVGLWLGVLQAEHRGRWLDRLLTLGSLTTYATPAFWLGLMLALLFGLRLRWLPVTGVADPSLAGSHGWPVLVDRARHLVLPVATLSLVTIASSMRYQRAALLEVLGQPFITAARARGLPPGVVRWGHAWRASLPPVLTLFGLWLPIVVVGSVFVEQVFSWPGLGSLAAAAAGARDYPVVMGTALLATTAVVAGNLVADLLLALLDPRVRCS